MIITDTDIKYNRPPLPFVGNKRLFLKPFCEVIKSFKGQTVFDAFGGSGFLSRCAKDTRPDLNITLNDISDYSWRLSCVKDTNLIKLFRASYPDYKEYIPTASRKGRFARDMMIYNF